MGLPGLNHNKLGFMCLAEGHNALTQVSLEPAAPRSQAKHSTTEPLPSLTNLVVQIYFLPLIHRQNRIQCGSRLVQSFQVSFIMITLIL